MQVLLGTHNWRYCILSHLGVWLKLHFELNLVNNNEFVFSAKEHLDIGSIKSSTAYNLWQRMKSTDGTLDFANKIANNKEADSHSTCKFGVNLGRGDRKSHNDVGHGGLWKGHDHQHDQYVDTTITFVDASVANMYSVRKESGVSSEWTLNHIMPHMHTTNILCQVCIVLDQAMLWKVWESAQDNGYHCVPVSIMARLMVAVRDIVTRNQLEAWMNLI
jgi:hypothetical protein